MLPYLQQRRDQTAKEKPENQIICDRNEMIKGKIQKLKNQIFERLIKESK